MGENLEGPEWASIAEASRDENVPLRTLYRWRKSNAIAFRVEDGVTLVRLADVRARTGRGRRETPMPANDTTTAVAAAGAPAGTHAGNGTVAGKVAGSPSPELVARLFRLFDEGIALEAIVQREQLLPQTVLELHRQYESLLAAGGRPSLRDRMAAHEEEMAQRLVKLENVVVNLTFEVLQIHSPRLTSVEERISAIETAHVADIQQLWAGLQRLKEMLTVLAFPKY